MRFALGHIEAVLLATFVLSASSTGGATARKCGDVDGPELPIQPTTAESNTTKADELPAPDDDAALFAALAKLDGFEAKFSEKKHLSLLKAPLETSGRLYYLKPGMLAREVVKPEKSLVRVSQGIVTIIDERGSRRIDLRSRPGVASFVESFSHVLSGRLEELSKHYRVEYSKAKEGNGFTLTLTPRGSPLNQLVQSIEIEGRGLSIFHLVVRETNGDRTVTRLSDIDAPRKFSESEKRRFFGKTKAE